MSLVKIIQPGAWDFGDQAAHMIKLSGSRMTLSGLDRQLFTKRAGEMITHMLDGIKFASGEIPIHLLAVGATEHFGSNRNGDGFDEHTCRTCHDTFVKYARFYRDHKNKDRSKSYGIVKASCFNERMKRIELICALNGTKEAALHNGGLLADIELQKLANDDDMPVSMSCSLPFDVCSWCGNRSRSRRDYCDSIENGGHCKAGGLKHHMGEVVNVDGDVHQLHAGNPDCRFFDISRVWRPADRIAYVSGQLKAAGVTRPPTGAELAESYGVTVPYEIMVNDTNLPISVRRQLKIAHQLAREEDSVNRNWISAQSPAFAPELRQLLLPPLGAVQYKFASVLRALADAHISLSPSEFLTLFAGHSEKQAASSVAAVLPGVFNRLISSPDLEQMLANNPYTPGSSTSDDLRYWARKQAESLSLAEPHYTRRLRRAVLRELPVAAPRGVVKSASEVETKLAYQYALYKLAFVTAISPDTQTDLVLTAHRALAQNYTS